MPHAAPAFHDAAGRRADVDAMRLLALATVFIAHAASPFDLAQFYHIKAPVRSVALHGVSTFTLAICIPILMFVVGWSAIGTLQRMSAREYLRRRLPQLLIPLAFGLIAIAPIIKFLELKSGMNLTIGGATAVGGFAESYAQHFVRFFTRLNRFSWSHLWFLAYLSLMSVALAHVLRRIATAAARTQVHPVWAFLPALPIAATELLLRGWFPDHRNLITDWCSILQYVQFVIAGAMARRDPGFDAALVRAGPLLLALAALSALLWTMADAAWMARVLRGFTIWGVVAGLYGVLHGRFGDAKWPAWLTEASFPLYVLHHVFFVAIAFLVIDAAPGAILPAAIILAGGTVFAIATYLIVRRIAIVRPLIGLPSLAR